MLIDEGDVIARLNDLTSSYYKSSVNGNAQTRQQKPRFTPPTVCDDNQTGESHCLTKHDQDLLNINKVCFASTRYGEDGSMLFRQESEHGYKFRIDVHRRSASQSKLHHLVES